jgi:hypothetical protein
MIAVTADGVVWVRETGTDATNSAIRSRNQGDARMAGAKWRRRRSSLVDQGRVNRAAGAGQEDVKPDAAVALMGKAATENRLPQSVCRSPVLV